MPKDVALRQAKLIRLKENPSPYNWAGFISIGNSQPIIRQNKSVVFLKNNFSWVLVLAMSSIVFLAFGSRKFHLWT